MAHRGEQTERRAVRTSALTDRRVGQFAARPPPEWPAADVVLTALPYAHLAATAGADRKESGQGAACRTESVLQAAEPGGPESRKAAAARIPEEPLVWTERPDAAERTGAGQPDRAHRDQQPAPDAAAPKPAESPRVYAPEALRQPELTEQPEPKALRKLPVAVPADAVLQAVESGIPDREVADAAESRGACSRPLLSLYAQVLCVLVPLVQEPPGLWLQELQLQEPQLQEPGLQEPQLPEQQLPEQQLPGQQLPGQRPRVGARVRGARLPLSLPPGRQARCDATPALRAHDHFLRPGTSHDPRLRDRPKRLSEF